MVNLTVSVFKTNPDGNCQFYAVANAVNKLGGKKFKNVTAYEMRMFLSKMIEENDASDAIVDILAIENGYPDTMSTAEKRTRIAQDIKSMKGLIWGNEWTLRVFSKVFDIGIAVFEKDRNKLSLITHIPNVSKKSILLMFENEHFDNIVLKHENGQVLWIVPDKLLDHIKS